MKGGFFLQATLFWMHFLLLARISGYPYAAEQAKLILNSTKLQILWPSHDTELEAVDFFKKYHNVDISFTDSLSFMLMRVHGTNEFVPFVGQRKYTNCRSCFAGSLFKQWLFQGFRALAPISGELQLKRFKNLNKKN